MEEIIELVHHEIKNSGFEKKLITGIVLTGGGSQLKHISQLVEFFTGIECRIGYPNEHLASDSPIDVSSPSFATGVGLVMKILEEGGAQEQEAGPKAPPGGKGLGQAFKKMLDKIDDILTNDL